MGNSSIYIYIYIYISIYQSIYIPRNSFSEIFAGGKIVEFTPATCKNAGILQKRRRIQKMPDLQMYVEAAKCRKYTHLQLRRNYGQWRRNHFSKNLQTRIASAGLKTPRSISRRLLPGKVAFFLKGKNKRAFGVSNNYYIYICIHTYQLVN